MKAVVVARAASAARFPKADFSVTVSNWPETSGPLEMTFRTEYSIQGDDVRVPHDLWIDVVGEVSSLDDALGILPDAAGVLTVMISISANAAIGPIAVHSAYDDSPGLSERDFFSFSLPEPQRLPYPGRGVNLEATTALIGAVVHHPEGPRLHRAFTHYCQALLHGTPGWELMAVAHLYMAVDTLTKIVVAEERHKSGAASNRDLAQAWGIDVSQLDAEVRRRIIFQGNASVQDELNAISDAFEHGYRPIPELRSRAASVVNDAARLVRAGILKACKLDSLSTATLLGPPFEEVQPMYPITAVVKGKLRGGGSDLAAPGERHPVIEWESSVVGVQQAEGSRANYQIEARSTRNRLGHGIEFEIEQIGFVVPPGVNVSQEPVQLRYLDETDEQVSS
jgi:hypothetical protein